MKIKWSHTEKALLISLFIELIIIALLFNLGFKEKPKEQVYAVEFIDDNFDFEDLKPEEKIELPDISKYIHKKQSTNIASNALQEEKSFEEFRQHHENALQEFYKNRTNTQSVNIGEEKTLSKKEKNKKEKRFTGDSNIRYFIKNRYDVFITNPLYTCPQNMTGLIVIDIKVDKNGKVVSAKYNKQKSTTTAECLIESAVTAAYESYFNADPTAPTIQKGYITYRY